LRCKGNEFSKAFQIFPNKNDGVSEKSSNFALVLKQEAALGFPHQGFRDVAQLVAHYVRDVGVGRSSRLIPTLTKRQIDNYRFGVFMFQGT
jgi:hypothetical protein